jgi:hypothetical protein
VVTSAQSEEDRPYRVRFVATPSQPPVLAWHGTESNGRKGPLVRKVTPSPARDQEGKTRTCTASSGSAHVMGSSADAVTSFLESSSSWWRSAPKSPSAPVSVEAHSHPSVPCVQGNRRASRNGPVSSFPRENLPSRFATFFVGQHGYTQAATTQWSKRAHAPAELTTPHLNWTSTSPHRLSHQTVAGNTVHAFCYAPARARRSCRRSPPGGPPTPARRAGTRTARSCPRRPASRLWVRRVAAAESVRRVRGGRVREV